MTAAALRHGNGARGFRQLLRAAADGGEPSDEQLTAAGASVRELIAKGLSTTSSGRSQ